MNAVGGVPSPVPGLRIGTLAFADDCIILANSHHDAQTILDEATKLMDGTAQLKFSPPKCFFSIFGKTGTIPWHAPLTAHGIPISEVESIKLLGVTFHQSLGEFYKAPLNWLSSTGPTHGSLKANIPKHNFDPEPPPYQTSYATRPWPVHPDTLETLQHKTFSMLQFEFSISSASKKAINSKRKGTLAPDIFYDTKLKRTMVKLLRVDNSSVSKKRKRQQADVIIIPWNEARRHLVGCCTPNPFQIHVHKVLQSCTKMLYHCKRSSSCHGVQRHPLESSNILQTKGLAPLLYACSIYHTPKIKMFSNANLKLIQEHIFSARHIVTGLRGYQCMKGRAGKEPSALDNELGLLSASDLLDYLFISNTQRILLLPPRSLSRRITVHLIHEHQKDVSPDGRHHHIELKKTPINLRSIGQNSLLTMFHHQEGTSFSQNKRGTHDPTFSQLLLSFVPSKHESRRSALAAKEKLISRTYRGVATPSGPAPITTSHTRSIQAIATKYQFNLNTKLCKPSALFSSALSTRDISDRRDLSKRILASAKGLLKSKLLAAAKLKLRSLLQENYTENIQNRALGIHLLDSMPTNPKASPWLRNTPLPSSSRASLGIHVKLQLRTGSIYFGCHMRNSHQHKLSKGRESALCPMCAGATETTTHLLCACPHEDLRNARSSLKQSLAAIAEASQATEPESSAADLINQAFADHSSFRTLLMAESRHVLYRLLPPQRLPSLPDAKKAVISSDVFNKMQNPIFKYLGCLAIHYHKAKSDTPVTPLPSLRTPAERNKNATPSQSRQLINSYTATDSNTTNRQHIVPPAFPTLVNTPTAASAAQGIHLFHREWSSVFTLNALSTARPLLNRPFGDETTSASGGGGSFLGGAG